MARKVILEVQTDKGVSVRVKRSRLTKKRASKRKARKSKKRRKRRGGGGDWFNTGRPR